MITFLYWLAIVLTGCFVAFVVTELLARAWLAKYGRSYSLQPFSRTRLLLDRETLPSLEPTVEHRINADGERGDPVPTEKDGLFRVLVVGGSAAECWLIDQKSSWPNVIQERLNISENLVKLAAKKIHVGNIGRSLVTCQHIDVILARMLPHYGRLDVIVFMVGASDLVAWLEKGAPSTIENKPIPSASIFGQHPDGPFGWGIHSMALRRIFALLSRRWGSRIDIRKRVGKRIGEIRAMRMRAKTIIHDMPDPSPMLANFDKWLTNIVLRARDKATRVIVVRQPWLEKVFTTEEKQLLWSYGVGRPYTEEITTYYDHKVAWQLHRLVDKHTLDIANSLNVEVLDLMPVLEPSFKHYYDDLHFTPEGCKVIGEAVANAIVKLSK